MSNNLVGAEKVLLQNRLVRYKEIAPYTIAVSNWAPAKNTINDAGVRVVDFSTSTDKLDFIHLKIHTCRPLTVPILHAPINSLDLPDDNRRTYVLIGAIQYGKGKVILDVSCWVDDNHALNDVLFLILQYMDRLQ